MNRLTAIIDQELHRSGGVLRLRPTYARRWYRDGGRLGLAGKTPGATLIRKENLFIPECWIASTSEAMYLFPRKNEGLSRHDFRAGRDWDEFFVSAPLAVSAHRYENTGQVPLELFKLFPQDVNS